MSHNTTKRTRQRRDARYTLREEMRSITSNPRIRTCGTPMGDVALKLSTLPDGSKLGGFAGLETCGSQACSVCSAKVHAKRQTEIESVLRQHLAAGGSAVMLTLTMRHHLAQGLGMLWVALSCAWKAATNGSGWKADREAHGVQHYVRVVELTHGKNGWHLHVHALLLGDDRLKNPLTRASLAQRMFDRWRKKLVSLGLQAPIFSQGGADIRYINPTEDVAEVVADYVSKGSAGKEFDALTRAKARDTLDQAHGLALEVARGDLKQGRMGNRTPFQILTDFVNTGDMKDLALWHEFERESKGKRTITWSRGLRAAYGLGAEQTDEEVAAEEHDGAIVAVMEGGTYRAGVKKTTSFPALVLNALERGGRAEVDRLLASLGLNLTREFGWVGHPAPDIRGILVEV
nr:unnamed protein product [uncultured bacterium]